LTWPHFCGNEPGGVAIVHGEAGVGKTRLVAELTELAGHTGGLTAIGTTPTIGCPPYWPWAELGSALLRSDLVFQWYLQPADGGGTIISVHVDIPEAEVERLEMQRNVIESSLRRLGKLAAAD